MPKHAVYYLVLEASPEVKAGVFKALPDETEGLLRRRKPW
jgi:hypothetical protein